MVLLVCGVTSCSADPTTAVVAGIVTYVDIVSGTHLSISSNALTTTSGGSNGYAFFAPLMAWATTQACSGTGCQNLTLNKQTFGSVIQDVGLDCSGISGCIPFWDQYGQERSQLKRLHIQGFSGIGVGIFSSNAQNGGPFEDIQMGITASASSICVEVGGVLAGGTAPMRGINGLTCTGNTGTTGTGVDINSNFSISHAHFENFATGVEIGKLAATSGVFVEDVTGGIAGVNVPTLVDISSAFTSGGAQTSDVNVVDIFQPNSGNTTLSDNISGTSTTEAILPFYSLGTGTGSGASSTRPVLTTSSTLNGSVHSLGFLGSTSGSTLVQPTATASGVLTLPAATDTLVGKATNDILTNKTSHESHARLVDRPQRAYASVREQRWCDRHGVLGEAGKQWDSTGNHVGYKHNRCLHRRMWCIRQRCNCNKRNGNLYI
jgi:hypothetical protein